MQINFIKSCLKLFVVLGLVLDLASASAARRGEDACYDKGVSGECTLFKDFVQVQPMVADELIRISLNDRDIEFGEHTNAKMAWQDDVYEFTDSAGATHKFWFDDMQESLAANVQASVSGAVCLLNNGEPDKGTFTCGFNNTPNNDKINKQLRNFGMWANCHRNNCYSHVTHLQGDLRGFVYNGQTIIDPSIFKTLQIVSKSEVHEYLRDYTMLAIAAQGLIMTGFKCLNMPLPYKAAENKMFYKDDVMVCTVKYIDPETSKEDSQTIDFLFDDMYEFSEKTASAGRSALVCNAQGGSASQDGVCAGFTKEMCDSMNAEFGVDTEWLPEQGGCIMSEVSAEAERKKTRKIVGATFSIVLGVLSMAFSGGSTAIVVVAAIGTLMTVISTVVSENAAKDIDFAFKTTLLAANQCLIEGCGGVQVVKKTVDGNTYNELSVVKRTSQQCQECATASIEELVKATVMYNGEIADADINASAYLLDVFTSVFEGRMLPICIAEIAENTEQSPLVAKKQKADTVALVGVLMTLGASGASGAKNLPKFFPKVNVAAAAGLGAKATQIGSKMQKMASSVTNILKNNKLLNVQKFSGNANKFIVNVSNTDSINSSFSGAAGIFAEYGKVCSKPFPCNQTIQQFLTPSNLNDLCGG